MLTERPWKLETVPYLLVGLFISICFGTAVTAILGMSDWLADSQQKRFLVMVANAIFVHGFLLVIILVFLRVNRMGLAVAFGLRQRPPARVLLLSAGAGLLVVPVAWLLGKLSVLLIEDAGSTAQVQSAVQFLQAAPPLGERVFMGFSVVLLAPLVEEMLFRGILHPAIKQAGFPRAALFGTAFLFAVYHSNLMTFVPLYVLAIVLALVYEATDNLIAAILLHAWFNAVNYVVLITGWDMERWVKSLF